ncbi:MAG: hypothetical protein U5L72_08600 [Bacteroidales bacterium]|nr:hypothetical protein [Bacteroidales bacterium]
MHCTALLTQASAKDCIGKFYPFTEVYTEQLYKGGPLNALNRSIIAGHPEEAIEPLRGLAYSSDPSLAKKAAHNLDLANRVIESKPQGSEEVWNKFIRRG